MSSPEPNNKSNKTVSAKKSITCDAIDNKSTNKNNVNTHQLLLETILKSLSNSDDKDEKTTTCKSKKSETKSSDLVDRPSDMDMVTKLFVKNITQKIDDSDFLSEKNKDATKQVFNNVLEILQS